MDHGDTENTETGRQESFREITARIIAKRLAEAYEKRTPESAR